MKISERDKGLLRILLILAIFCIPYVLVIQPMREDNTELTGQIQQAKERNQYLLELSNQAAYYQSEMDKMAVQKEKLLTRFPAGLPQEAALLFLAETEKRLPISLYQVSYGEESAEALNGGQTEPEDVQNESTQTAETALTEAITGLCISSEYHFSAGYDSWKEFLNYILRNQDRMVITAMHINYAAESGVVGTFQMNQYAIVGAERKPVQAEAPNLPAGTTNIFKQAAGTGMIEGGADFFLMLSPADADVEAYLFGKTADAAEETYLRSDSSERQEITMTFAGENGSYTVACSIGDVHYENVLPFTKNGMVNVEMISTPRLTGPDQVAANVHIINEMDTTLGIIVTNDDTNQPRVNIRTKTGAILMK